jgi:hypothetical protein
MYANIKANRTKVRYAAPAKPLLESTFLFHEPGQHEHTLFCSDVIAGTVKEWTSSPLLLASSRQGHEVVLVLLQKIKIPRKVQNRLVATVNEIIVQMNAAEINGLAVRIDEEPRVLRANTQRPGGFRR